MKKNIVMTLAAAVFCSGLFVAQTESRKQSTPPTRLIVGYRPSFRLEHFAIKELKTRGAAERMTHILYAFTNIANARPSFDDDETEYQRPYSASESVDGKADDPANKTALRGAFNQLRKLK